MESGEKKRSLELFAEKCIWCKDYNGIEKEIPCKRIDNPCIDIKAVQRELEIKNK